MASDVKTRRASAPAEGAPLEMGFLASSVGYYLKRAYLRVYDDFIVTLADLQLRPQLLSVLSLIVDNPGIIQRALARTLAIERSNIVLIIDDLVARGWVTRNPVPSDRRAYALHATPTGRQQCRIAIGRVIRHEQRMLDSLSESERRDLLNVLDQIGTVEPGGIKIPRSM